METRIISIFAACILVVSILYFGYLYLFEFKYFKSIKKINLSFLIVAIAFSIIYLVMVATYKHFGTQFDSEIMGNISSGCMTILLALIVSSLLLSLKSRSKNIGMIDDKVKQLQKPINIFGAVTLGLFYFMGMFMFVIWIVMTIIGNYIRTSSLINVLGHEVKFLQYILLGAFIILVLMSTANFGLQLTANILNGNNFEGYFRTVIREIGYWMILLVMLFLYLGLHSIPNLKNWFTREMVDFFTDVYTNKFSYLMLYLSINGLLYISLPFIKKRQANQNKLNLYY